MPLVELLGLRANVVLDDARVSNRVVIDAGVPHLDEKANPTGEISVVGVMEVVRLAALHETGSFTQVVRHACLHGNDLRASIGIASLKKRLRQLDHLRGFDNLSSDKAPHRTLADVRAQKVIELLVADKARIMQSAPLGAHIAPDALIKQELVRLTLVLLAIYQRLIL